MARTIALMQGRNVVGISYRIRNRSLDRATLRVRPHLQFVPKGQRLSVKQEFIFAQDRIQSNGQTLYLRTNGDCRELPVLYREDLYYQDDVRDGKMALGRSAVNHEICFSVEQGQEETLEIVYGMEEALPGMTEILQNVANHRKISRGVFLTRPQGCWRPLRISLFPKGIPQGRRLFWRVSPFSKIGEGIP